LEEAGGEVEGEAGGGVDISAPEEYFSRAGAGVGSAEVVGVAAGEIEHAAVSATGQRDLARLHVDYSRGRVVEWDTDIHGGGGLRAEHQPVVVERTSLEVVFK